MFSVSFNRPTDRTKDNIKGVTIRDTLFVYHILRFLPLVILNGTKCSEGSDDLLSVAKKSAC